MRYIWSILEDKWMKNAVSLVMILFFCAPACFALAQQYRPLPIYPQSGQITRPNSSETERAHKLYELARKENHRLQWDSCLAAKAVMRARRLVSRGYFEHEDPQTGKNPVWASVNQCVPIDRRRFKIPAGENLAKGIDTPTNIHRALMDSPTHRKNILDPRFNRLGVGCYDNVCVELFMGI